MGVELLEGDAIVVVAADSVDDLEQISLFEAVAKFIIDFLHVLEGNLSFAFVVYELESASTSFLRERSSLCQSTNYNLLGEFPHKGFEV